jgi:UDP-N-acetyl-D-galactosamine dehydrogenase
VPDTQHQSAPIAIVGLGYVGLPLAVEFGRSRPTIGFDIDSDRVAGLAEGRDWNLETNDDELRAANFFRFTDGAPELTAAQTYIVTVPTPLDDAKRPGLQPLIGASRTVGQTLAVGDLVIYESTVYPGATEEVCIPVLEEASGLTYNKDFFVGYSPERINPGDKKNRLPDIIKVTSGSTPEAPTE